MIAVRSGLFATLLAVAATAPAQLPPQTISVNEALDRVLKQSSLTHGKTPFHAVMTISGPTPVYSGQIDLVWLANNQYRLTIASPSFHQLHIVNGSQIEEHNDGDYYPRWLENFVDALLDPIPMEANFRGRSLGVSIGPDVSYTCASRDDRPGGITDQLTWGDICFSGAEPRLLSTLTFNRDLEFSDYKPFGKQQIARTYKTEVLDHKPVTGRITTLEAIKSPDVSQVAITAPTPGNAVLATAFVSTLKEESLIEHPPAFNWPPTGGGKPEGYMIVYARTDRTGQVRETAKHNSDNPGLEQFGMEQALTLKFKPLLIDGVPQQMEMPLVLHFKSQLVADPTPVLNDEQTRAHISGCSLPKAKPGQAPFRIRVSVDETGKLAGETYLDANTPNAPHQSSLPGLSLRACKFAPYLVNGKPSYYHGVLLLP